MTGDDGPPRQLRLVDDEHVVGAGAAGDVDLFHSLKKPLIKISVRVHLSFYDIIFDAAPLEIERVRAQRLDSLRHLSFLA